MMLRKIVYALLVLAAPAFAQVGQFTIPDCQFGFTYNVVANVITSTTSLSANRLPLSQGGGNVVGFDNRDRACTTWSVMYQSEGVSAVSLELDSAPSAAGIPGSWTIWPSASLAFGATLPLTITAQGNITAYAYRAWVSVNLNSATGTGQVYGRVFGWRAGPGQDVASGAAQVQGLASSGTAVNGNPVLVGGSDGSMVRTSNVDVLGRSAVFQDPSQTLFEDFGQAFTQGKWNATAGGTGTAPTSAIDAAGTTLSAGATLNGFSALSSVPLFEPTEPGFVRSEIRAQLTSNVSITTYNFWGLANLPATPTIANPVVDGCGFDWLQATAKLFAVCYQGTAGTTGTRVVIQDLSASTINGNNAATTVQPTQPGIAAGTTDMTNVHKYVMQFSGALAFWYIDGKLVASIPNGANGPNNNTVAASAVSISNSGTANPLSLAAFVVGDTSKRESILCDPLNEWLCAKLTSAATQTATLNTNSVLVEKPGRWQANNSATAASGVQGTIGRSAGAAGVRHVVDCISFSADSAAAVAAANVLINLRDGASGAGSILHQWAVSFPTAAGLGIQELAPTQFCGLNLPGTAATAMTIEFSAGVAGSIQSVNMTGYDIQ